MAPESMMGVASWNKAGKTLTTDAQLIPAASPERISRAAIIVVPMRHLCADPGAITSNGKAPKTTQKRCRCEGEQRSRT